jgi:hypothetical protein
MRPFPSSSGSTSTYCLRQWVVQVRRSARPATSTHRIEPTTMGVRVATEGVGRRRRTALTRRARWLLASGPRHGSR